VLVSMDSRLSISAKVASNLRMVVAGVDKRPEEVRKVPPLRACAHA
jgi:hypothetical protein